MRCCAIEVSLAARGSWSPKGSRQLPRWASDKALSRRQVQVAACLAQGLTDREIAARLRLSLHTVRSYEKSLYDKLGLGNRTQVAHYVVASLTHHDLLGEVRNAPESAWARRLGLPPRLARVAACVCRGLSDKQTASALRLCAETVRTYVKQVYRSLGVRSRAELSLALHRTAARSGSAPEEGAVGGLPRRLA